VKHIKINQTHILLVLTLILSLGFLTTLDTSNAAKTIYVDSVNGNDANDGLTPATAKQTINGANLIVGDGDTIQIAGGTYTGPNNRDIFITKDVTIQGAGQTPTTIDPENNARAFTINPGKTVTINNLTIQNGRADEQAEIQCKGGAIYNMGTLTVTLSDLVYNTAQTGYGGSQGGAIYNSGTLTVTTCSFTLNKADSGGAIYNTGTLTVTGGLFTVNMAECGAAIFNDKGTLTVTGSRFDHNTGTNIIDNRGTLNVQSCEFRANSEPSYGKLSIYNGAIYNEGTATVTDSIFTNNKAQDDTASGGAIGNCGVMKLTGCTFTGNSADNYGGAIYNLQWSWESGNFPGTLNVKGCTFTGNTATWGGGAIYNDHGNLTITGSTFTTNNAKYGGAIYNGCDNPYHDHMAAYDVVIKYCRIVGNTADQGKDIYNMLTRTTVIIDARDNWWGSNFGPEAGRLHGPVNYIPWLKVSINAVPSNIYVGQTSLINVDLYTDSSGGNHRANSAMYPPKIPVKFYTNLGSVGSQIKYDDLIYGERSISLRADQGPGEANPGVEIDGFRIETTVNIQKAPTAEAGTKTVAMQPTGTPITALILALLMVLGGLVTSRRK